MPNNTEIDTKNDQLEHEYVVTAPFWDFKTGDIVDENSESFARMPKGHLVRRHAEIQARSEESEEKVPDHKVTMEDLTRTPPARDVEEPKGLNIIK